MLENALYLMALLNPASKVMFLSTYEPSLSRREIVELAWKSSLAALLILIGLAAAGEVVLSRIFKVELYSLRITGGLILFVIGWTAVREGRFLQKQEHQLRENFTELSLVPLAAPLIGGRDPRRFLRFKDTVAPESSGRGGTRRGVRRGLKARSRAGSEHLRADAPFEDRGSPPLRSRRAV